MKPLKDFEEFIKKGIMEKRSPDIARAKSLIEEAKKRNKFIREVLSKVGISEDNANYYIENSYDILIETIRARLLLKGYNSSGQGSHEAEVAYLRKMNFKEGDVRLMNELRCFRNGIKYYGKRFTKDDCQKILHFLKRMYPKLNLDI
ncbi:MAG: hypothetical protein KKG60_00235 [Nanoarchaeota archaeon]|nr:hypothetical protein [Nanoarchaeota archaeon]